MPELTAQQIKAQYPGYVGWNDPAAIVADFRATGGAGKEGAVSAGISAGLPGPSAADILKTQREQEEQLLGQFQTQVAGQEALPAAYTRLRTEAGIPGLEEQLGVFKTEVYKTRDLLDRLEEDITSRITGTMTTEAQRRRMVAAEEVPLQTTLARLGTGMAPIAERLTTAAANVQTMLGLTSAQQERELAPIKMRISAFSERASREITGYTAEKQRQLDLLLRQLQEQGALSRQQMSDAAALTKQEAAHQDKFAEITAQMEANITEKLRTAGVGEVATTTAAKNQLLADAQRGVTLSQLISKYGGKISTQEITRLYTGVGYYGPPEEPWAREILGLEPGGF